MLGNFVRSCIFCKKKNPLSLEKQKEKQGLKEIVHILFEFLWKINTADTLWNTFVRLHRNVMVTVFSMTQGPSMAADSDGDMINIDSELFFTGGVIWSDRPVSVASEMSQVTTWGKGTLDWVWCQVLRAWTLYYFYSQWFPSILLMNAPIFILGLKLKDH